MFSTKKLKLTIRDDGTFSVTNACQETANEEHRFEKNRKNQLRGEVIFMWK